MKQQITYRIILDVIIALCIIHGWWFFALPLALIGVWRFPYFVEIIVAGIIYDALFGFVPEMYLWGYVGTVVSIVSFGLVIFAKKLLRK